MRKKNHVLICFALLLGCEFIKWFGEICTVFIIHQLLQLPGQNYSDMDEQLGQRLKQITQ